LFFDTKSGQQIATSPATLPAAFMPAFSPDSQHLAFTHIDSSMNQIAIMDYDGTPNPPAFSNVRDLVNTAGKALVFPSYVPDSRAVLYQEGTVYTDSRSLDELRLVQTDLDPAYTGNVNEVKALNGRLPDGSFYLPYGATEEGTRNHAPTVVPRPIGGYYWAVFSSRRAYGNTISPGGTVAGGDDVTSLVRKKIWVSAIDLDHWGKTDPSHPAFFLPGQPLDTDAKRPFVALEPCAPLGASCESGADCCDGFCRETGRQSDGTPILQCVPPPDPGTGCSNLDEYCSSPADCCDPTLLCILNRCALPAPPPIF
jgi:hypothetical protein